MDRKLNLQFEDWQEYIKNKLGQENWLTVYEYTVTKLEKVGFYCALIPHQIVDRVLTDVSWDLRIGNGLPGHIHYSTARETKYFRYGTDDGIEPLVIHRSFYGMKEPYLEISEEFRYFFNLYYNKQTGNYTHIDDNGDEEEVVKVEDHRIQIKLSYIKKFLAIKTMYLAIYFEVERFSEQTLAELGLEEAYQPHKGDNYIFSISINNWEHSINDNSKKAFSILLGKKLLKGLENYRFDISDREGRKFVDFIIGVDRDGREILYACDESRLSNYFGKNPGSPNFLTPVFFKKEVLNKYYAEPSKYSVGDGYLKCGGLWGLRMDNNHERYVIVHLGYLGYLSYKEQLYWRTFNVSPEGKISNVAFRRGILGQFTDPEKSDLYFKQRFQSFQEKWQNKFGWKLFQPLSKEDEHHFKTLRIPLTNEQKEFDEQILSLAKILIDSLNERELAKGITIRKEEPKGIDKLEAFLESKGRGFGELIEFFRSLQGLRSAGVAHLKGKNYDKIKKVFGIEEKELSKVFDDILKKAIEALNLLENGFIRQDLEHQNL